MALVSKWFKVATAGDTIDGREIKNQWLTDIAETYDKKEYTASIFKDHWLFFGAFGVVNSVKTGKDDKGRLCLFAKIEPNQKLLELNKNGEGLFTSISVIENHAGTDKAYLGHLAITDIPASLGTDQLSFSQIAGQLPHDFIASKYIETDFDLDEAYLDNEQKTFFSWLFKKSNKPEQTKSKQTADNEDETDMKKEDQDKLFSTLDTLSGAVTALAKQQGVDIGGDDSADDNQGDESKGLSTQFSALTEQMGKMQSSIDELKKGQKSEDDDAEDNKEADFAKQLQTVAGALETLQTNFNKALQETPGTDPGAHDGEGKKEFQFY